MTDEDKVPSKNNGPAVQLAALRAIVDELLEAAEGQNVKPAALAEIIESLRAVRHRRRGRASNPNRIQVIQQLARAGVSQKAIAEELGISVKTVQRNWPQEPTA